MSPTDDTSGSSAQPSFIQTARRGQLVEAAIETLAAVGYGKASTVLIAQRAGVSRGVLTYHFRDRDDLIAEVVATVYALGVREVGPQTFGASSPRAALLGFAAGSVEFYAAYPTHIAALTEIFNAGRHTDAPARPTRSEHNREMADVQDLLVAGQRDGQFRDFDAEQMASIIRAVLDVAAVQLTKGGSVEVVRHETVRAVDALTRQEKQ
ncbi:TetR/AcrR family transcriptional regulator [Kribbella italica]|uniref:AcrR family transcriptional regulator n=1 Tax=Kribbella italica TaxID=1540520 RepID=A0A7W9JAZ8_9ACTN|nr:TetR/AcrR family transcriptional regulator [Kribbella italica]MBB5838452.1 AcrR family transcriptional regulator [Kribbella italica]